MNEILEQFLANPQHPTISALTSKYLESVLLPPDRVGLPSSWWGHVPFAHWLVHELKPCLLVELGTHHGISFSAFCNAVRRGGQATRCYAVDTWRGDEFAGFYDESVFNNINSFVQQNYSSFATLIRSSFESAVELFADGSIDLLHIDGRHTYDAVRTDFETWLPKVSDRGIVLFHDTAIYEHGFGVWRFWEEISQRYPSFEFRHSCGLGMLAVGRTIPECILALIEMEPTVAAILRQRLAELGERWISVDERVRASVAVDGLSQDLQRAKAANANLQQEAADLRHGMRLQAETAEATNASIAALRQETAKLQETLGLQRTQLASATEHATRLQLHLEEIRTSRSWRLMGPYRVAGRFLKRRMPAPFTATRPQRQLLRDFRRISRSRVFNASFYLGRESAPEDEDDVIMQYLATSRDRMPRGRQHPGAPQRRPILGFHPLAYAALCKDYEEAAGEDPLAHYLRAGMPDGPWKHVVIQAPVPASPAGGGPRILIHLHFHYPDLFEQVLHRIRGNASTPDIFVTATSEAMAAEIKAMLGARNDTATVVVVPNRGRDIGPMLMHFSELEGYDVVGHVHGKRSPQQSGAQGSNWRDFLWDHLVGGDIPMMDLIAEAFASDERLGLVFPEDPNLNHWDMNQDVAQTLADRMELRRGLPSHFEFPKGSMFWARPAALRPLVDLGWRWTDFPAEPAAPDGTVLHALERLIPFSAEHAGFGFKTVHVPHSWRMPVQP